MSLESSDDLLARAGIRTAGFVDSASADRSNDAASLDTEFKDTIPIGDLTSEMVSELVSAFCRDTRLELQK